MRFLSVALFLRLPRVYAAENSLGALLHAKRLARGDLQWSPPTVNVR